MAILVCLFVVVGNGFVVVSSFNTASKIGALLLPLAGATCEKYMNSICVVCSARLGFLLWLLVVVEVNFGMGSKI